MSFGVASEGQMPNSEIINRAKSDLQRVLPPLISDNGNKDAKYVHALMKLQDIVNTLVEVPAEFLRTPHGIHYLSSQKEMLSALSMFARVYRSNFTSITQGNTDPILEAKYYVLSSQEVLAKMLEKNKGVRQDMELVKKSAEAVGLSQKLREMIDADLRTKSKALVIPQQSGSPESKPADDHAKITQERLVAIGGFYINLLDSTIPSNT